MTIKTNNKIKDLDPNGDEWIKIDIPTLKKYGVKPFEIMKRKMRKDDRAWNNINFYDAKKEAEKLGYRLPDIREMLALLECYKEIQKNVSIRDKDFLGIEELSYDEQVYYEWIEGAGVAFKLGGYWDNVAVTAAFTLYLYNTPASMSTLIGFRCVRFGG